MGSGKAVLKEMGPKDVYGIFGPSVSFFSSFSIVLMVYSYGWT